MAAQEVESIVHTSGGIEGAGAGGGLGLNAPGAGPKVTHFTGSGGGGKKNGPTVPQEVNDSWEKLMDDVSPLCYVLALYSSNGKALELVASGPEEGPAGGCGMNMFKAELEKYPDRAGWGGFRCNAVDNRQNTTSKRSKFVFVQYMPSGASAMRRAKMGPHKGFMKDILHGAHCDLLVETVQGIKAVELVKTLQAATGAHKPQWI
eukprot:FR735447.1.p1 GENE.FR735447.1~~FR735447.1.p1  ORF type:complete len:205 (+),score=16.06 FR735447.1:70-684(+)